MRTRFVFFMLLAGCFQPWTVSGLYLCGGGCPEGLTCDDGVCCNPSGDPACPTRVPDSGVCPSGAAPRTYYADLDKDSFGNAAAPLVACGRPVTVTWVEDATDCDDTSASAHPGGTETCDGRDNDCDGTVDDGQAPQQTYYRDSDADGFGDAAQTLSACATPPGYANQSGDCAPMDDMRHPGATELCNGLDDNCDGQRDEGVTIGVGQSCADAGMGECNAGTTACVSGAVVCSSNHAPSKDLCNGLDDNCDGAVDERPSCGGPLNLVMAGAATVAARDTGMTAIALSTPTSCLKALGSAETWSPPTWSGSKDTFHVWYAEAPGTTTWDLSESGKKLHLQWTTQMFNNNTTTPWNGFNQPFVLVCNETATQFSRYRPEPTTFLPTANATVNTDLLLSNGGPGWILAKAGADLTQVKRIEVVVQPASATGTPSFNITFDNSTGLKP